jgi:hypothetical protein
MDEADVIRFKAQVSQVRTLADGGLRVVLDLPEDALEQVSALMRVKQIGVILEIAAVPISNMKL